MTVRTFTNAPPDAWIKPLLPRPQSPALRLFCFPYAGGGASIFRAWPFALPAHVDVVALQLPAREERILESPLSEVEPLMTAIVTAMRPHLTVPFALFGHSMGALLAFETAHRLEREGFPCMKLIASGCRAPHLPSLDEPVSHLPDDLLIGEMRRFDGTPKEILLDREILDLVLPAFRADLAICERYVPPSGREPLSCPITAFGGLQDAEVGGAAIVGWKAYTNAAFTHRMFAGGHFFVNDERATVLRALSIDLARAEAASRMAAAR